MCFPLEPRESLGIVGKRVGQDFERDITPELRVAGTIHFAHPTAAKGGEDFVRTDAATRGQGQGNPTCPCQKEDPNKSSLSHMQTKKQRALAGRLTVLFVVLNNLNGHSIRVHDVESKLVGPMRLQSSAVQLCRDRALVEPTHAKGEMVNDTDRGSMEQ
jgi:hypothetical protein